MLQEMLVQTRRAMSAHLLVYEVGGASDDEAVSPAGGGRFEPQVLAYDTLEPSSPSVSKRSPAPTTTPSLAKEQRAGTCTLLMLTLCFAGVQFGCSTVARYCCSS